jgi:hypothetical protein
MDLLAQPAFRADAVAIADDQHADQQLGVDRRSSSRAVERCKVWPNLAKIDEAVDRSQHMVGWHMLLDRELVKQSTLLDLPSTHHHLLSRCDDWSESVKGSRRNRLFQQNRPEADNGPPSASTLRPSGMSLPARQFAPRFVLSAVCGYLNRGTLRARAACFCSCRASPSAPLSDIDPGYHH